MPNICSAFNCKSGYKSQIENQNPDITMHSFPKDEDLAFQWFRLVRRSDSRWTFSNAKKSFLCSLHFMAEDFVEVSEDSHKGRRSDIVLKRK